MQKCTRGNKMVKHIKSDVIKAVLVDRIVKIFLFHLMYCNCISCSLFSNSFIFYSLACIAVFSLSTIASNSNPFSFINSYALQSSRFLLLHLSYNPFPLTDMFSSYMPSLSFSDTFLSLLFLSLALHYSNLSFFCTAVLKASFDFSLISLLFCSYFHYPCCIINI